MAKDKTTIEPIEVIRGSGNVFRDLGLPGPDMRQHKTLIAADIVKSLDASHLTAHEAADITGLLAEDFAFVRSVKLDRFSIDDLMIVRNSLAATAPYSGSQGSIPI